MPVGKNCPACRKANDHRNKDKIREYQAGRPRRDRSEYGRKRRLDSEFRAARSAYTKEWREQNQDRVKASFVEYRRANPEKVEVWNRTYREKNREQLVRKARAWAKAHPLERAAQRQKRRALLKNAIGEFSGQEWAAVIERQRGRCFDCGAKADLTVGHKNPISNLGCNLPLNIIGQCASCNSKQHDKIHPTVTMFSIFDQVHLRS